MRALRLLLPALALAAPAAAHAKLEDEVKAAYLFRFLSYVEWPAPALDGEKAPFVIGIVGADDVYAALNEIVQGRSAQGRPVEVRRLRSDDSVRGVHLLFVGRSAASNLPRHAKLQGVVVVSEVEGGLNKGAIVNLLRAGDHVRFEVAPDAAERRGLRISSRMLAVAEHVKTESP